MKTYQSSNHPPVSSGGEGDQEKATQVLTSLHLTNIDILGC